MSQKSYNNTPTLFLIPTPIGNMDDITLRAISTLKEVEVIFSEDTRVTRLLLNHLNIKKKLIASHEHNEYQNKEKLLNYLENGYNVGLVSDRGTPIISDPGYELTKFAIEKGYNVVGLPGPTALISALIVSGINPMPFMFYGFLNSKESRRKKELETLKNIASTIIFYEAPHRVIKTIENIIEVMGNRNISISREISKKYEEIYRGKAEDILKEIVDIKGEIVIVVDGEKIQEEISDKDIIEIIDKYVKNGMKKNDAIKLVSKENNLSKNEVYNLYHHKEDV